MNKTEKNIAPNCSSFLITCKTLHLIAQVIFYLKKILLDLE